MVKKNPCTCVHTQFIVMQICRHAWTKIMCVCLGVTILKLKKWIKWHQIFTILVSTAFLHMYRYQCCCRTRVQTAVWNTGSSELCCLEYSFCWVRSRLWSTAQTVDRCNRWWASSWKNTRTHILLVYCSISMFIITNKLPKKSTSWLYSEHCNNQSASRSILTIHYY